ncbi:unnamed protein product, partial [Polarella glacialis]
EKSCMGTKDGPDKVKWSDGDVWHRVPADPSSSTKTNERRNDKSEPAASCGEHAPVLEPPFQSGLGSPVECRTVADFDGTKYGQDYLSFKKGELVLVQPEDDAGWRFGFAVQSERSGWLPAKFVKLDN